MEIRWLGQSCFVVTSGPHDVYFEPYPALSHPKAKDDGSTVVTFSHAGVLRQHRQEWGQAAHLLEGPGEYEIAALAFRGIPTPLTARDGSRSLNTVYVMEAEGISVCHVGTLAGTLATSALQAIGNVDILMVPAGGPGIMPVDSVASMIRAVEPDIVIPMHYVASAGQEGIGPIPVLLKELGVTPPDPAPRLSVSRSNLPPEMKVVLLRASA
ncbi:MAG: MBL fold metallo-hydrolase [SAR202 cluster bacterium]|nr:MBL fold metallo-hydrolase [SAR202 cluster bacterium]